MSVTVSAVHAAQTMCADDKGSVVNRAKCTGEHFKNDAKFGLRVATVSTLGAGLGYAAYKNPNACVKIAKVSGKAVSALGKLLEKVKLPKIGNAFATVAKNIQNFGAKIVAKAPTHGKIGVIAALGTLILSAGAKLGVKHAYNAGKIDQKYVDNAKIEKMTGSVVV